MTQIQIPVPIELLCVLALGAIAIFQTLKLRVMIRIARQAIAERDAKIRELSIRVVEQRGELNRLAIEAWKARAR